MKTHAIHWKSTVSGNTGTGTKRFGKEEAGGLATELNERYPDIDHEAVILHRLRLSLQRPNRVRHKRLSNERCSAQIGTTHARIANISMLAKF